MNKYDIKYIFKRVLIFFIIFIIMSFINSCEVNAQTISFEDKNGIIYYNPAGYDITNTRQNTLYYNSSSSNPASIYVPVELLSTADYSTVFNGKYLIDFYIYGVGTFYQDYNCSNFTSNFRYIDLNTGNWVSSTSKIKSNCVSVNKTKYNGYDSIHILYSFTLNTDSNIGATEFSFQITKYNFFTALDSGTNIGYSIGNLYDYDVSIVDAFNNGSKLEDISDSINNSSQNIINNQNTNTSSIINNQNQNKQDIIDNQNANTDKEIESQNVCSKYDKNSIELEKKYLTSDGTERSSSSSQYGISKYISINSTSKIKVLVKYNESDYACFYNINKQLISCINQQQYNVGDFYPIPDNASYFRYSLVTNLNRPQLEICSNGNQVLNDSINDLNDNINDDNIDGANSQVDDLLNNSAFNDDSGIQSIINAPLNFINGLTNSCSPINITIPYINSELSIPCIKQELNNHVPTLVPILSTAINGFVIYRILIDIVYLVKSSRNPDDDRIEVLDL